MKKIKTIDAVGHVLCHDITQIIKDVKDGVAELNIKLPEGKYYLKEIDFEKHPGQFLTNCEPKLPWLMDERGKYTFLFQAAFNEMLADFAKHQPSLVSDGKKVPYDWTIYYLRKKALTEMISKEELAWILLNFNQKRGYYQLRGAEEEDAAGKSVEFHELKVLSVEATDEK